MQERRRERATTRSLDQPHARRSLRARHLTRAETCPWKPRPPARPGKEGPAALKTTGGGWRPPYFLGVNLPQAAPSIFSAALSAE